MPIPDLPVFQRFLNGLELTPQQTDGYISETTIPEPERKMCRERRLTRNVDSGSNRLKTLLSKHSSDAFSVSFNSPGMNLRGMLFSHCYAYFAYTPNGAAHRSSPVPQ